MAKYWITYRTAKGRYYIGWRDCDGRQHWKSTGTDDERKAKLELKRFVKKMGNSSAEGLTKAVDNFLDSIKNDVTAHNHENHRIYLRRFLDSLKGKVLVGQVVPADVGRFKNDLRQKGRSDVTVNHYLSGLNRFFKWSVENGLIAENPVAEIERAKGTYQKRERIWTDEEFNNVIEATYEPYTRLSFYLMRYAGLRNSEATNLKWADIDDGGGWINVIHDPPERRTKTGQSRATILTDHIKDLLKEWSNHAPESEWIFANHRGQKMASVSISMGNSIKRAGYGGIIPAYVPYNLRHNFSTEMQAAGWPKELVAFMMGHRNTKTTDRYTHFSLSDLENHRKGNVTPNVTPVAPGVTQGTKTQLAK